MQDEDSPLAEETARANGVTALARLNVSQPVFAQLLGISAVLVRWWERGARSPAPIARRLLDQVDPKRFLSLVRHG